MKSLVNSKQKHTYGTWVCACNIKIWFGLVWNVVVYINIDRPRIESDRELVDGTNEQKDQNKNTNACARYIPYVRRYVHMEQTLFEFKVMETVVTYALRSFVCLSTQPRIQYLIVTNEMSTFTFHSHINLLLIGEVKLFFCICLT